MKLKHQRALGLPVKRAFKRNHKQEGFIQAALLFGIALITAVLGGYALANRTPTSQTDQEQAKVNASVILKQAADLRDGVQRYSSDNGSSAVQTVMDFSTGTDGLFNVTNRYASPQVMPSTVFDGGAPAPITTIKTPAAGSAGHWYFIKTHLGNGIGSGTADPMVALPDIRQDVCGRVNRLLYGSDTIPTVTGAVTTVTGDTVLDLATSAGTPVPAGWAEGCYQLETGSEYVYFKVLQEN
ncbi:MAG: hypothetical protein QE278_06480 [Limnobacter sp.]|nr:hypothetical protein [Limnobacter sp.]